MLPKSNIIKKKKKKKTQGKKIGDPEDKGSK